jgi:hypothetical protein
VTLLLISMATLAIVVALLFLAAVWNATRSLRVTLIAAIVVIASMTLQHTLAANGILREWDRRPPPMILVAGLTLLTLWCAWSKLGARIAERTSFAWLVGTQAFRLPVELTMHRAFTEGQMPEQMSYSGYNFDILTGVSAIVLAALLVAGKASQRHVRLWNAIGFCLLVNIVGIAVASLPPIAAFGPERVNVWVTYPPFVWLPGVLVQAALLGHMLVWRKLFRAI